MTLADSWELICHHTYAGIPGVIPDLSPLAMAPGRGVGLNPADYQADGSTPGSGAVALRQQGGWIDVGQSKQWGPSTGGLKIEITAYLDPSMENRGIMGSTPFDFYIYQQQLICTFGLTLAASASTGWYSYMSTENNPGFHLPIGRWTTLGLENDGQGHGRIIVDGNTVAQSDHRIKTWPLGNVRLGETRWGQKAPLLGLVDDLKIWRINPHRIGREFLDRPIDGETVDCLKNWTRALRDAMERNVECAESLPDLALAAVDRMIQDVVEYSPEARQRMEQAVEQYHRLWNANNLGDELVQVIVGLSDWLADEGISFTGSPEFEALKNSPCIQVIAGGLPPLDCDPDLKSFFSQLAYALSTSHIANSFSNSGDSRA